jgi:glycine cleavage system H lipoate-binding protein
MRRPRPVLERSTRRFRDVEGCVSARGDAAEEKGATQVALFRTGVCMLTLALDHPLVRERRRVVRVSFDMSGGGARRGGEGGGEVSGGAGALGGGAGRKRARGEGGPGGGGAGADFGAVATTGKYKRGGAVVAVGTPVCRLEEEGGRVWTVRAPLPDMALVQCNTRVLDPTPSAVVDDPHGAGWLAIFVPTHRSLEHAAADTSASAALALERIP